jgi:hypothetical protein
MKERVSGLKNVGKSHQKLGKNHLKNEAIRFPPNSLNFHRIICSHAIDTAEAKGA